MTAEAARSITGCSRLRGCVPHNPTNGGERNHSRTTAKVEYDGGKVIVVSGGNDGMSMLSFPARFDYVLGVISLNRSLHKSSFSNFGITNFWGDKHPNIIAAPGGEKDTEPIFYSPLGIDGWGTSFAAAYVTALVNYIWSQHPLINENDYEFILFCLKHMYVDKEFPNFNEESFGNGKIILPKDSNVSFDQLVRKYREQLSNQEALNAELR